MKIHNVEIKYYESTLKELNSDIQQLFVEAEKQLDISYAPYSEFNVGASLLLENDKIVVGCNQENASYPLCLCGERVALYNAGSNYPNVKITALAITCRNNKKSLETPVSPCGACRQVIHEFSLKQDYKFPIYLKVFNNNAILKFDDIDALLPFSFTSEYLF